MRPSELLPLLGFVTFSTSDSAARAVQAAHRQEVHVRGTTIKVDWARGRPNAEQESPVARQTSRSVPSLKDDSSQLQAACLPRLFVRDLPDDASDHDIQIEFEKFGKLTEAKVPHHHSGKGRIGFFTYEGLASSVDAHRVAQGRGIFVRGRRIKVEWAREHPNACKPQHAPEAVGLKRSSTEPVGDTTKRQRTTVMSLEDRLKTHLLSALAADVANDGMQAGLLLATYYGNVPAAEKEQAKQFLYEAGGAKTWLRTFPEFDVAQSASSTWVRLARASTTTPPSSAASSSDATSSTTSTVDPLLEQQMKRRLLDRLSTGSIDLGEARNFLCGQYAPHDERARAETLISVAGGTRKWLGDWPEVAVVQPTGRSTPWVRLAKSAAKRASMSGDGLVDKACASSGSYTSASASSGPSLPRAASQPSPKALGKSKVTVLATSVTLKVLPSKAMSSSQAHDLATATGCELCGQTSAPPSVVLRGTPSQLEGAALTIMGLHMSKDGTPRLTLSANEAQINAIHGDNHRGLLDLKKATNCRITIDSSSSDGCGAAYHCLNAASLTDHCEYPVLCVHRLRKIQLQRGDGPTADPKKMIAGAVKAIAELWQASGSGGSPAPLPLAATSGSSGSSSGTGIGSSSHEPPLKRGRPEIMSTEEQLKERRRARFAMPPPGAASVPATLTSPPRSTPQETAAAAAERSSREPSSQACASSAYSSSGPAEVDDEDKPLSLRAIRKTSAPAVPDASSAPSAEPPNSVADASTAAAIAEEAERLMARLAAAPPAVKQAATVEAVKAAAARMTAAAEDGLIAEGMANDDCAREIALEQQREKPVTRHAARGGSSGREKNEPPQMVDMPKVGTIVRALDHFRKWYDAKVIDTRPGEVKIHFVGYKKTPTHVKWLPLTSADLQLSKRSDKGPGASSRPTMQRLDAAGTTDGEDETSEQDGEEDEQRLEDEEQREADGDGAPRMGTCRWHILCALLNGHKERAAIVDYITRHSDIGKNTRSGSQATISTWLGREKRKRPALWFQSGNEYSLSEAGEAMRGSLPMAADAAPAAVPAAEVQSHAVGAEQEAEEAETGGDEVEGIEYENKQSRDWGGELVGKRITIFWDGDEVFFPGRVSGYELVNKTKTYPDGKQHKICYDDGEIRRHCLLVDRWYLLEKVDRVSASVSDGAAALADERRRVQALQKRVAEVEGENVQLQSKLTVELAVRTRTFEQQQLALRSYVHLLRQTSGKGASDKWSNFIVRRDLKVPALRKIDEGKICSITDEDVSMRGKDLAATRKRLVSWGVDQPEPMNEVTIVSVEEEIGKPVKIRCDGSIVTFSNPSGGLVTDVLGFMKFGSKSTYLTRQDLFKPTDVTFEGESGVDMAGDGGLSQDMFASFWRGVIESELGLFDHNETALPACDAPEDQLELVGLFLCKSIIDEKLIGRGLCPFLFEFLLDDVSRSFDATRPMSEQVRLALDALAQFDPRKATSFREILHCLTSDDAELAEGFAGAFTIENFVPGDPDEHLIVTSDNVEETMVKACKHLLWKSREGPLLAMRRGFSTQSAIQKEPIDLRAILMPFSTPDLGLLIQGRGIDADELVEKCIEWPDESMQAKVNAGFPPGSSSFFKLLEALLRSGDVSAADFLHWATGRREVPFGGLAATEGQRIKLVYAESTPIGTVEARWPLPQARTCVHTVTISNFSNRAVLRNKLCVAIAHRDEGFQRDD